MRASRSSALILGLFAIAEASAQKSIPVRTVTAPLSTADVTFRAIAIRPLMNGNLFVNDGPNRRLYLFDSTLTKYRVVFDSTPGAETSYGNSPLPTIAYLADTTLALDLGSQSMLVIDPNGQIVRVIAQPSTTNPVGPAARADNKGRLIYRGRGNASANADSVVLVRADLMTRRIDTVGVLHVPGPAKSDTVHTKDGDRMRLLINPLQASDDWMVLSDGSLAIVRVRDYHIDWVRPDGKRESSAKMPLDWRRLSDEEKQHLVDSVQAQMVATAARIAAAQAGGGGRGGGAAAGRGGGAGSGGPGLPLQLGVVSAKDVPDYVPPLRLGSMRADMDGNLWIPPSTSLFASPTDIVYDVVNLKGEIVERVKVPIGKTIAGFGKGGNIYLSSGNPATGGKLERVKVKRD